MCCWPYNEFKLVHFCVGAIKAFNMMLQKYLPKPKEKRKREFDQPDDKVTEDIAHLQLELPTAHQASSSCFFHLSSLPVITSDSKLHFQR